MVKTRAVLLVVALFVVSLAVFAQSVRRDGKWEVKMETIGPSETTTQCVTPKDVDDPLKVIPGAQDPGTDPTCKFQDHKVDGNKVTWSMKCDGLTGTVELIYSANAYTCTAKMSGDGANVTVKYTAKRLGDCNK
jgi:hypothetical protein